MSNVSKVTVLCTMYLLQQALCLLDMQNRSAQIQECTFVLAAPSDPYAANGTPAVLLGVFEHYSCACPGHAL